MSLRKILLAVLIVLTASIGIASARNPLRRSEEQISTWLQEQTPLGSSREFVITYAEKKKWYDPRAQGSDGKTSENYVRGELGNYRTIFVTSVTVFWEFDSASRLVRVRVWKTVDAL
jgi:hypothetical protein